LDLYDGLIAETQVLPVDIEFLWSAIRNATPKVDLGALLGIFHFWRIPPRNRTDIRFAIETLKEEDPFEGTHFATLAASVSILREWFGFAPEVSPGLSGLEFRKALARGYGNWFSRVYDYTFREYSRQEDHDGRMRYRCEVRVNLKAEKAKRPVDFLTGKEL